MSTLLTLPDDSRARLERELAELARSAALGTLAADVAHDLANPLFGMLGLVDLLLANAAPGSEEEGRLLLIRRTALELKDTLHVLLETARRHDDEPSESALDAATRAAVALLKYGSGRLQPLSERYPAEPVRVPIAHTTLVHAILQILLASRQKGPLSVEVSDAGLRVSPAPDDMLGVLVAARIVADHGGAWERDGDSIRLHWVG